ncbi:hypothetical protein PHMEG_00018708 [Phytophthora megakarya]|uniref:Uncharacterized protein n=1 Tax=Phytophthora megakarya TaxID=4795 RepID=A0A225VTE6_9STRA|nr:hypothetical protein PHMEG_00018708 [Phytophthora megakarya]
MQWEQSDLVLVAYWINSILKSFREELERNTSDGSLIKLRCTEEDADFRQILTTIHQRQVAEIRAALSISNPKKLPTTSKPVPSSQPHNISQRRVQRESKSESSIPPDVYAQLPVQDGKRLCLRFLSNAGYRANNGTSCHDVSPQDGLTLFQKSSTPSFAITSLNVLVDLNLNTLFCDAKNGTILGVVRDISHRGTMKNVPHQLIPSVCTCRQLLILRSNFHPYQHFTNLVPPRCHLRVWLVQLISQKIRAYRDTTIVQIFTVKISLRCLRLSVALRKLGLHTPSKSYSRAGALNTTAKSTLSAFVREHQLGLAETVRIYRNETSQDSRPNKTLDPSRLKVLLKGYPHLSVLLDIARHGISPVWHNSNRQTSCPPNNHLSFTRHQAAALRSVNTGQASGHFLVVDASIMDMWPNVHCSPFGAVEKSDVDPCLEVRLIHDLSFPNGSSTNELLDKSCLPEVDYAYVTVLAARIEDLASRYPQSSIKMLKGDVKGAYRHLMTNANHVHQMAGLIRSLDALIIDLAAPFGWSGSPQYYDDNTPFFGYEWVDDHVMIEIDSQDRLLLAESTLRHAMLAVLGSRSINEAKFTSWLTRLTVLGLTWDTVHRSLSIHKPRLTKDVLELKIYR